MYPFRHTLLLRGSSSFCEKVQKSTVSLATHITARETWSFLQVALLRVDLRHVCGGRPERAKSPNFGEKSEFWHFLPAVAMPTAYPTASLCEEEEEEEEKVQANQ